MFETSDRRARTIVRLFSFYIPLSLSLSLFRLAYLTRDTSVDALGRSPVSVQPRTVYSRFIAIRVPLRETRGIDDETQTLGQSSITYHLSFRNVYIRVYIPLYYRNNKPCAVLRAAHRVDRWKVDKTSAEANEPGTRESSSSRAPNRAPLLVNRLLLVAHLRLPSFLKARSRFTEFRFALSISRITDCSRTLGR